MAIVTRIDWDNEGFNEVLRRPAMRQAIAGRGAGIDLRPGHHPGRNGPVPQSLNIENSIYIALLGPRPCKEVVADVPYSEPVEDNHTFGPAPWRRWRRRAWTPAGTGLTMLTLEAFPDIEKEAVAAFTLLAPTGTVTPQGMAPPFIRVRRIPNLLPSDVITDRPMIEVSCYGDTRAEGVALAKSVEEMMLDLWFGGPFGAVSLDLARLVAAGIELPYESQDTRRFVTTYQLALRRPPE